LEAERYILKVFYLGGNYYGFVRQPNLPTIEGKIIEVLKNMKLILDKPKIKYASRTDRGVHALGQTLSIEFEGKPEIDLINEKLPVDIAIWAYSRIIGNFNPRRETIYRHYKYVLKCEEDLNISVMEEALKAIRGIHDFKNLCYKVKSPTFRRIYEAFAERRNETIIFEFIGSGFARGLIRKLITIIVKIGREEMTVNDLIDILKGKVKQKNVYMAPPQNLYLIDAFYPISFRINEDGVRKVNHCLRKIHGDLNPVFKEMERDFSKLIEKFSNFNEFYSHP